MGFPGFPGFLDSFCRIRWEYCPKLEKKDNKNVYRSNAICVLKQEWLRLAYTENLLKVSLRPESGKECWALLINTCPWSFPVTAGVRASPDPISCKSDHRRLSSGCVKCLESTDMSWSMENRPEVLYKQAKVALDSFYFTIHASSIPALM